MNKAQQNRFNSLYQDHVNALIRQGKAQRTIDGYSRAVRRITEFYDQCPDRLTLKQLNDYFLALVKSHSWSTVKVDRNGLQFFYEHVLGQQWEWVDIVKPPQTKTLPDILTIREVERVVNNTRELRYQTFIFVTYSMGLRIGEALNLRVSDIDSQRMKVHVRLGKGKKDRFVTLPKPVVLHTHTRRLAYHPHVHVIVPGGGVHRRRNEWRKRRGSYLFNGHALANVFRARLLTALKDAALPLPKTPAKWVAQCQEAGYGDSAIKYLSRYLYRGVISDQRLILQWVLQVTVIRTDVPTRACFGCPTCHGKMTIINITRKKWTPG